MMAAAVTAVAFGSGGGGDAHWAPYRVPLSHAIRAPMHGFCPVCALKYVRLLSSFVITPSFSSRRERRYRISPCTDSSPSSARRPPARGGRMAGNILRDRWCGSRWCLLLLSFLRLCVRFLSAPADREEASEIV